MPCRIVQDVMLHLVATPQKAQPPMTPMLAVEEMPCHLLLSPAVRLTIDTTAHVPYQTLYNSAAGQKTAGHMEGLFDTVQNTGITGFAWVIVVLPKAGRQPSPPPTWASSPLILSGEGLRSSASSLSLMWQEAALGPTGLELLLLLDGPSSVTATAVAERSFLSCSRYFTQQ
jgi:hypothetical protein